MTPAPDAAVVLAAALGVALLAGAARDPRRLATGRGVVLAGIGVWYLHEALRVPRDLREFTQEQYDFGVLCVALAAGAFLAGYGAAGRSRLFDGFAARLAVLDAPRVQWACFAAAACAGLAPMLLRSRGDPSVFLEGVGRFGARFGEGYLVRGRYGGLMDAILELMMFLKAALPFAVVVALDRRSTPGRRLVAGLYVAWMLSRAAFTATRSDLVAVGAPLLAAVYWGLSQRRQRAAVVFGLPALLAAGFVWSAAVVVSRTSGEFRWEAAEETDYTGNEMFRELLSITSRVPESMDYRWGETYLVQLVNPIPRAIWPGKPVNDAGLLLARLNGEVDPATGEPYLTRSPGLIGEMYWNFGLPGIVVLSAFGGFVVRAWDRFGALAARSRLAYLVYCGGFAVLFLFGRSFNLSTMYGLLSLAAVVYGLPALGLLPRAAPARGGAR